MTTATDTVSFAHTPGPWGIEQTRDTLWIGRMRADGYKVDHVVVSLNIDSGLKHSAALRQLYNARLIAAAPVLLGAANEAFDFLGGVDGAAEIRGKLLDAIISATGGAA